MNKLDKFIVDSAGQWKHPGKKTMIPNAGGRITMKGVKDKVLGIDDKGNKKIMLPGKEYQFPGNNVYEIPLTMKKKQMGGTQDDQQQLMAMIQQYAQGIGADPNQILQELQSASPEEQQGMIEQITAALQEGMSGGNPFAAESMQLGGAPEDHTFPPNPEETYNPMDMEFLQMGGDSKQNKSFMNKTNNFVNWLKTKSMEANMKNMMDIHMMPDGSMMSNDQMQKGGNYVDQNGFYHNVNKEAAYMLGNQNPEYNGNPGYNPLYQPFSGGYASLFNTPQQTTSKLPRDMAIKSTNTNTISKKKSTTFQGNNNPTVDIQSDQDQNPDVDNNQADTDTQWNGEWYDPNQKQTNPTGINNMLAQNINSGYRGNNYQNNNFSGGYGGYGMGTPYFNFGYSPFQGLLGLIPNAIMALGSLGQFRGQGNNTGTGRGTGNGSIFPKRDTRPNMNKNKTINLDYSNDPNHIGDKGDGIKSLQKGPYPNPYMSYEDEIKLLAEQNAPTNAEKLDKTFSFLKKKRPVQFGGMMKAQDGSEIDLQNPDYFNLEYNIHDYPDYLIPQQDVTYTDPNANFAPAPGPKSAPAKGKGTGFMGGFNPFAAESAISDINAITAMKNQADMQKADRLQKKKMNDVTLNHSTADQLDRGDWFSGPGLAHGMFRPNQNIYEGPNAFAKKGGTFFNSNFYQIGGENESPTEDAFEGYEEGAEMFLTDEQIQQILDAGGDIEFL
jgi:hypothetical protein